MVITSATPTDPPGALPATEVPRATDRAEADIDRRLLERIHEVQSYIQDLVDWGLVTDAADSSDGG